MSRGQGIKPIHNLFAKYHNTLRAPQGSVITVFCEVVQDVLGVTITKTQVEYTPNQKTVLIKTAGPLKSEILLQKNEILTHLKGRLGERSAPIDIL